MKEKLPESYVMLDVIVESPELDAIVESPALDVVTDVEEEPDLDAEAVATRYM